jgi:malate dehydrogenase
MFHSTTHRLVLLPLTRPRVTCHLATTTSAAAAATTTATSALRRTMSSTSSGGKKVAVLGAAGGIGQPLSLLLKLSPHVSELSCYDIVGTPGVAADLSHVRRE